MGHGMASAERVRARLLLEALGSRGASPWWHLAPPAALGALQGVTRGQSARPRVTPLLSAGWSSECLLEWDSFVSLAIPSMLMMCIEWWTYEIGSFLIGQRRGAASGRWTGCDPEQHPQQPQGLRTVSAGHPHPALTRSSAPGLLSVVELSAQSIIYEVSVVAFMVRAGGGGGSGGVVFRSRDSPRTAKNQLQQFLLAPLCS